MKIISKFNNWQRINEQNELDVDPKEDRKSKRKANKRKFRKEDFISDSGATYTLIKQKDSDDNQDTFVLKGKGKDSPIWDKKGIVVKDVEDFLNFELFSGENEGKYDEDSIEMEKYREGKRKDRVKFTIGLVDQEKVKAEEAKKKEEEEAKKKAEAEKAAKSITIPKNTEGENRIEIGQTSDVLPTIKEMIRKGFVKKGFKMGSGFGMDWLNSDKLEEKDAAWVKALRAGFGMPLKDFISQGLVDKLVAQVEEWEKDEASNESKIPMFESYMIILEQFDMEAAMNQMSGSTEEKKPAVKKKKAVSSGASTGFSKEQGDQFRKWANSAWTKEYYGKSSKFDLDETGGHDNSYIRRALAQAKKDEKNQTGPFAGFFFRNMWGRALQLIIDGKWTGSVEEEGEVEGLPMGYIQYKQGDEIAVHFSSPRPAIGTIKKGDIVVFKNGWDGDDFGYLVKSIWKDSSGNLGALYIDSPSFVKKFGKPNKDRNFENKAGIVTVTQAETSNLKDVFIRTSEDEELAKKISRKIVSLWNPSNGYFNKFKSNWGDNEAEAISYFTTWWNGQITPLLNKLDVRDKNKTILTDLFSTIVTKAEGSTSNDTASWRIWNDRGDTSKYYSVDTDF